MPHASAAPRAPVEAIPAPPPSCSVVIPTHRRAEYLPGLLGALAALDPAPAEIIVVDSAPGEHDCRERVRAARMRYLREDAPGASRARNAGIAAARGELIAFLDDDCVPPPDWLAAAGENFSDPHVAVSTGPAFPFSLDTRPRVRIEQAASFGRGVERRVFDWTTLPIEHAGEAGASANMIARRAIFRDGVCGGEGFPVDLGPGTLARSGDDTYLFARVLAAGRRIVYDPRQFVYHRHRADWPALHAALSGYGTGLAAMLAKSALRDGELEAPLGLVWLLRQYLLAQRRRIAGEADAVDVRMAWDYLRGAAGGPGAWWRAAGEAGVRRGPGWGPGSGRGPGSEGGPGLGRGRRVKPDALPRVGPVVVAEAADADADTSADVVLVRLGVAGGIPEPLTGAAAAAGTIVFLDPALQAPAGLLDAHRAAQARCGPRTVVLGAVDAYPAVPGLDSSLRALQVHDSLRAERAQLDALLQCLPSHRHISLPAQLVHGARSDADLAELVREALAGGAKLVFAESARAWLPVAAPAPPPGPRALVLRALERLRLRRLWLVLR